MKRLGFALTWSLVISACTLHAQDSQILPPTVITESPTHYNDWQPVYQVGCDPDSECASACPSDPVWSFQADALFLHRTQSFSGPLAFREPTLPVILDGDDLDFDFEPGLRLLLGYQRDGLNLEASYRGFLEWSELEAVRGDNDVSAPGALGLAGFDFFSADLIAAEYTSSIQDIELNQLFLMSGQQGGESQLDVIAGFRLLLLDEQFKLLAADIDTGDRSIYRIRTDNHLIGGQLGLRHTQRMNSWFFMSQAKAGLFGNPNHQEQLVTDLDIPLLIRDTRTDDTALAFVGELEFALGINLNPNVTVKAGYLLTWIDGVSLAPDQLDFTNNANSGTSLDDSGSFLAHGFTLGVTFLLP